MEPIEYIIYGLIGLIFTSLVLIQIYFFGPNLF